MARAKEGGNTALIKHRVSKTERCAQRARKGEMEFLEVNNFPYLLSLINIEMNPLRRRSSPLLQAGVENSPSFNRLCAPADSICLPGIPSRPHPEGHLPCLYSWEVRFHSGGRTGQWERDVQDFPGILA